MQIPRIAKFNEIPFTVISIQLESGQRTYSEELLFGGRYSDFTGIFEGVFEITGSVIGDDNWEAVENIFQQPEIIKLTLPTTNATEIDVLPKTTIQCNIFDNSRIGFYQFTVQVERSELRTLIAKTNASTGFLSAKLAYLKNVANVISNTYKTVSRTVENARNTINDIANQLTIASQAIPNVLNEVDKFTQSIQQFQNSLNNFINLPSQLTAQIQNLVVNFTNIANTAENQVIAIKNVLTGDFIRPFDNSCSFLLENSNATVPIQTTFYCYAISDYTTIVSNIEYKTADQVQIEIDYLRNVLDYAKLRFYDYNLLNSIRLLINNTIIILKQKQVALPTVQEGEFYGINDYAAYYMFYGNIDNINNFRLYNNIKEYGIVSQKVKFI